MELEQAIGVHRSIPTVPAKGDTCKSRSASLAAGKSGLTTQIAWSDYSVSLLRSWVVRKCCVVRILPSVLMQSRLYDVLERAH
eukprot:1149115-Amphidinium_carterae.1